MNAPHPGTREYRNQAIRLADLTVTEDLLVDLQFEHCEIIGPAVLAILENVTLAGCRFDAPNETALLWLIPTGRDVIMGAVGARRVEFFSCKFTRVGLAIPEVNLEDFKRGFGST